MQDENLLMSKSLEFSREEWIAMYDRVHGSFEKADTNHDNKLSKEEWFAMYGTYEGFDAADLDHDGFVTQDEMMAREKRVLTRDKIAGNFREIDANNDGKISREEWIARYGDDSLFDQYDLDGDGVIDPDEFLAVSEAKQQFADGIAVEGKLTRAQWIAQFGNDDMFDAYDANHDGVVDAGEWIAGQVAETQFKTMDGDQDGKLSRGEWVAQFGDDKMFDAYDLDGDGIIDPDEWLQGQQANARFQSADQDNDGKLSREEWIQKFGDDKLFNAYDLDGDGVIDPEEWLAGEAAQQEMRLLDADGDGKISRAEWIARYGTAEGFDMYDLDGDGIIDPEEFIRVKQVELKVRKEGGSKELQRQRLQQRLGKDPWEDDVARAMKNMEKPKRPDHRVVVRYCVRYNSPQGCPLGESCTFDHVKRPNLHAKNDMCYITDNWGNRMYSY